MPSERQPSAGTALIGAIAPHRFVGGSTDDRFIIEEHDHREPKFGPKNTFTASALPDYGILHSTRPGYRLVSIQPAQDKVGWFQWIWSNERNHQDSNTFSKEYAEDSADHPKFTRRYVTFRESFVEPVYAQPLKSVVGLVRTADGTSGLKDGIYDLVFSGGGGTGVAGKFQIVSGAVVAQWLTNVGENYTSNPTVTLPDVDGATITAFVQPQTAVLVHCEFQPADEGLGSIFLNVVKVYETLPGPALESGRYNERGDLETIVQQKVLAGTAPTADGLLVTESEVKAIDDVTATKSTATVPSHSVLTTQEYDRERANGAKTDETEAIVAPGTTLPTPDVATLMGGILDSKIVKISATKSRLITRRLAAGVTQPMLHGTHIDESTGICVDFTKQMVTAGTRGGKGCVVALTISNAGSGYTNGTFALDVTGGGGEGAYAYATITGGSVTSVNLVFGGSNYTSAPTFTLPAGAGAGASAAFTCTRVPGIVEVQPFDEWLSIAITSIIRDGSVPGTTSTIPPDTAYATTSRESFPNVLRDVELLEITGTTTQQSYNLIEGYSGEVYGRLTQKYMTDADYQAWRDTNGGVPYDPSFPTEIFHKKPDLTQFFPQANRVAIRYLGATIYTRDFPMSLHPETSISLLGGNLTATLPATVPTDLPYDEWIVKSIKPEQWKFDYWLVQIVEILVPPDFQTGP